MNKVFSSKKILLFMLMGLHALAGFSQRLTVKDLMDCLSLEKSKTNAFLVKKGYHATTNLLIDIPESCKDYQVYASDKKETSYSFISFNCAAKGVEARTPLKGDFDRYKTELVAIGFQLFPAYSADGTHVSGELTKNDYVYTCHMVTRVGELGNMYYITLSIRKK